MAVAVAAAAEEEEAAEEAVDGEGEVEEAAALQ